MASVMHATIARQFPTWIRWVHAYPEGNFLQPMITSSKSMFSLFLISLKPVRIAVVGYPTLRNWQGSSNQCVVIFEILSDLNQAVPNHLADKSQSCWPDTPPDHPLSGKHDWLSSVRWSGIAWFKSAKISRKTFSSWRPAVAFLYYLFLFRSLLRLTSFKSFLKTKWKSAINSVDQYHIA